MIRIYGKLQCPKCKKAKEKLALLHLEYTFCDLSTCFDGWRDTLVTEARAWYEDKVSTEPDIALPTIEIDGTLFTYPQAMKILRTGPRPVP